MRNYAETMLGDAGRKFEKPSRGEACHLQGRISVPFHPVLSVKLVPVLVETLAAPAQSFVLELVKLLKLEA